MYHAEFLRERENPEYWERMIEERGLEFVERKTVELGHHPCVPVIRGVISAHKKEIQNQIDKNLSRQQERAERQEFRETENSSVSKRTLYWTAFGVLCAVAALALAVKTYFG